jgi:hypothetical protein
MAVRCVAAGGRLGIPWRTRRRAARRGTEPGLGRGRRVEEGEAGGGAAAAAERRPGGALHRRQEKQSRAARARGIRIEGGGPGDLFGNSKNFRGLSIKKDFPLI